MSGPARGEAIRRGNNATIVASLLAGRSAIALLLLVAPLLVANISTQKPEIAIEYLEEMEADCYMTNKIDDI